MIKGTSNSPVPAATATSSCAVPAAAAMRSSTNARAVVFRGRTKMDILTRIRTVIKEPEKYFKSVQKEGFREPLAVYIFTIILIAFFQALYFSLLGPNYLIAYIGILLRDTLSLFLFTGMFHLSLKLFKGRAKYQETVKAYVYGFLPSLVLSIPTWALLAFVREIFNNQILVVLLSSLIGLAALAIAFYSIYLVITGFSVFHLMSKGRALIAFIVPLTIFFFIFISLFIFLFLTRYPLLRLGV